VIEEASNRKYKVQFSDGEIHVVTANISHIEQASTSLPLTRNQLKMSSLIPIGNRGEKNQRRKKG
jgi:hypothetical protein